MKILVIISLTLTACISALAGNMDTIKVFFDLGVPTLNKAAMLQLDSLAYYDVLVPNKNYGIIGYADYLGSEESNVTLSQNRANAVQQYLQGLGIKQELIETVTGKGEINRGLASNDGYPEDRRVDIVLGGFKKAIPKPQAIPKPVPPKVVVTEKPAPKIDISNVEKDETIRLDNILFLPGSHRIREESIETLFHLYVVMKDHPNLKIRLEGHICCLKNTTHDGYDYDTQEYRLSENRAKAVYEYLAEKGIDEERLQYKGFGISKPLVWPERSFADENMNRRVEVRILEK
jgi:outer membrane protein OmpA-like peptidoglycan-associated protein